MFAGRYGPRRFMVMGPAVMALGILWLGRFPADSQPWRLVAGDPSSWLPPTSYLTDVLPAMLIYGFGLTMLVAPLTTALMGSVPVERAGLASAINNAVSRVGPQLAGAAIFIAITAVFYAQLAVSVPSLDVDNPEVRAQVAPLNPPADGVAPDVAAASSAASTDSFRVAMWISAGLMAAGALVNLRISDSARGEQQPGGVVAGANQTPVPSSEGARRELSSARLGSGEHDPEGRTPRPCCEIDRAVMLDHDRFDGREAEPGPFVELLGGEEVVEHVRLHLVGDSQGRCRPPRPSPRRRRPGCAG